MLRERAFDSALGGCPLDEHRFVPCSRTDRLRAFGQPPQPTSNTERTFSEGCACKGMSWAAVLFAAFLAAALASSLAAVFAANLAAVFAAFHQHPPNVPVHATWASER